MYSCSLRAPYVARPSTDIPIGVCQDGKWEPFLRTMALTLDEFRNKVQKHDLRSELFEFISPPLIEKYPVLALSDQRLLVPWAPFVASRLCYGIYDILKETHGNDFTQAFGDVFQAYVAKILELICEAKGLQLIRDRDLDRSEEQPDFAIADGDRLIPIEVKAVEDDVYLNSGRLVTAALTTLGKAAQQCDALWGRYLAGRESVLPEGLQTCIPAIVTWRPFFWANTHFYRETVFRPRITHEPLLKTCQTINVADFEGLAAIVLNSPRGFGELLARKTETNPEDDWRAFIGEVFREEAIPRERFAIPGVTDRFKSLVRSLEDALQDSGSPGKT